MSELLDFLRTHEDSFRSPARLASLYSDFRHQRNTNPDGYQANAAAWLRALCAASKAGLIPTQAGAESDRFVLKTGEELSRSLQTQEFGRPLALGAVLQDAVDKKELVPLSEFLEAKESIYAKTWIPTPWQAVSWALKQLGVMGGESVEDKLVAGRFVVMANVEAAAKAVLDEASKVATSNTSRIFSEATFASTFALAIGVETLSNNDLSVLLTHLARDRAAIAFSPHSHTVKFISRSELEPSPITAEDTNIASIRALLHTIEPQIDQLTARISDLDRSAKEAVAKKNLIAARSALRSKKMADTKLQRRITTLTQLEDVYAKIEQAADQVEMIRIMELSSQTLGSLNKQTGGVERVQDVMDELRNQMMDVDDVTAVINEESAGKVDEGEVEDELEAMENVEREKAEAVERREHGAREAKEAAETKRRLAELDAVQREIEAKSDEPVLEKAMQAEHT